MFLLRTLDHQLLGERKLNELAIGSKHSRALTPTSVLAGLLEWCAPLGLSGTPLGQSIEIPAHHSVRKARSRLITALHP